MDFKKLAESVAVAALHETMDNKNIGQIAEKAAETALENVVSDLPQNSPKENPTPTETTRGNIISSIVSVIGYFLSRLFRL